MGRGSAVYRRLMLALFGNRLVERLVTRFGARLASRFVAGEDRTSALLMVQRLNRIGISATLDHLGESVRSLNAAAGFREEYLRLLDGIRLQKARSTVSVKPTQMGLALDPECCLRNVRQIAERARKAGTSVCLDMEDSRYTEATLDLVRQLREEGFANVTTVLQSYLFRSEQDAARLLQEGIALRLVKGAYQEKKEIAFANSEDILLQLHKLIRLHLDSGAFVAIGSHDDRVIGEVRSYAERTGIDRSLFEFQMLYGLRMEEQAKLAGLGYQVRCYVPYGRQWYPYFTRRLAEKPGNLWLVVRNLFR
ncbi:proline dehydrogenase family protein [Cohnella sp. AR92]|uniref:proline dehydrogenase family protein n=1 Tax=Cohnella sp. AR92 TaxID=648716 RepID=UPI000F8C9C5E|nr:proline dehydrogenase family protein [Cohnella sp. AR92]RUS43514.1 proline dehydrogenase [Cohnella sp. AR92]